MCFHRWLLQIQPVKLGRQLGLFGARTDGFR